MKFEDALAAMRQGKKVARSAWAVGAYRYLRAGEIATHYVTDGMGGIADKVEEIAMDDILADDWHTVGDYAQNRDAKCHTKDYRDMSGWWWQTCVRPTPDVVGHAVLRGYVDEAVRGLTDRCTDLDNRCGDIEEDVDDLRERLSRLSVKVEVLRQTLHDAAQDFVKLEHRVAKVEERVPQITYTTGAKAVPCLRVTEWPENGTGSPPLLYPDNGTGSPPPRQPGSVCESK